MEPERFGDYTLLKKIAVGGTAEIFLARRHGADGFARHLAIKRILPHLAQDAAFAQLLLDEARLAAHLHHGHIVQIHEVGREADQVYIAMEYLPGSDVGRLFRAAQSRRRRVLIHCPDTARLETLGNALSALDIDVVGCTSRASLASRSAEGAVDLFLVDAEQLGPMRDPVLHQLQRDHPELMRSVILGDTSGRGHGAYAICTPNRGAEAALDLARDCLAPQLPMELAIQIARAVGDGLEYAHTAVDYEGRPMQIVHRDVNPSNVLVAVSGLVKLVDFGIARAVAAGPAKDTGNLVGTFRYMSPEQTRGKSADTRSDIFSFGTLLHTLVTGRNPYEGASEFATMRAIREDALAPMVDRVPGVPAALQQIVDRASQKSPDARYATTEALLGDLEEFARQDGINLSPKRLARFMEVVYGKQGVADFGVGMTGYVVSSTPSPRVSSRDSIQTFAPAPAARSKPEADVFSEPEGPIPAPRHPLDRASLQLEPPAASRFAGDRAVKLVLALLIVLLVAGAGWYWHWRSTQPTAPGTSSTTSVGAAAALSADGLRPSVGLPADFSKKSGPVELTLEGRWLTSAL